MRQDAARRALAHDLNPALCDRLGVTRVRIGDSNARPNVRTSKRVHRDVESIAGRGPWRPEKAPDAGVLQSVSRVTVIPLHVEDAGIELQMSIEQAAFCARLVAPQRVLADPRRGLWAINE